MTGIPPNFAFVWRPEYSVHHPLMDAHHKALLTCCQNLVDCKSLAKETRGDRLRHVLDELANYAKLHFRAEEELMQSIGFAAIDGHAESHDQYAHNLTEFNAAARLGTIDLDIVIDFMTRWWVKHILHEDMQYAQFFRKPQEAA